MRPGHRSSPCRRQRPRHPVDKAGQICRSWQYLSTRRKVRRGGGPPRHRHGSVTALLLILLQDLLCLLACTFLPGSEQLVTGGLQGGGDCFVGCGNSDTVCFQCFEAGLIVITAHLPAALFGTRRGLQQGLPGGLIETFKSALIDENDVLWQP